MIYLLLMAALAVFYWRTRPRAGAGARWRMACGLLAIAAAAAAGFTALRGGELKSALLLLLALGLAAATRWPRPVSSTRSSAMSPEEARATLGVDAGASRTEIEAAYARLIRRVHPDLGGASGLAAQLNRARDRLLRDPL